MTAAIYCRISVEKEEGCSIDMQRERAKAFCISQGWDYIIYEDNGYSGKDIERPAFQQLMRDAKARKFNSIIVYRLDRISRNKKDFFNLMDEFEKLGIGFRSLTENFDTTTPTGRAMMAMVVVFAQLERETIAERVRDNMIDRAKSGRWNGGPIPFGFERNDDEDSPALIPVPEEAEQVLDFHRWYQEPGGSIRKNVFRANKKNIPTKTGAKWNPNQMARILRNPLYCIADAYALHYFKSQEVIIADESKFDGIHGLMFYNRRKPKGRTTTERPMDEWILAVGDHKGIIPGSLYVETQKKLDSNKAKAPRKDTGKRGLLTGLIRCSKCGMSMNYHLAKKSKKDDGYEYSYYKCRSYTHQGPAVCEGQSVRTDLLEEVILEKLAELATNSTFMEMAKQEAEKYDETSSLPLLQERSKLEKQLKEVKQEQSNLISMLGRNKIPVHIVEQRINELENERLAISERLQNLNQQLENIRYQNLDATLVMQNLERFQECFNELTFDEKRSMLRYMIKEIYFDEGKIKMVLFLAPNSYDLAVLDHTDMDSCW